MPRTNPSPDSIDAFSEEYNGHKRKIMEACVDADSALKFGSIVRQRLEVFGVAWSWRPGYINDLRGDKYSGGLSIRKATQVGLGYQWGDTPKSAYAMVALAFSGYWEPMTQDASVVRELLSEIFKLKTANMAKLLQAIRDNEGGVLGETENPIWLYLLGLQESYDFDDTDITDNTALSKKRIEEMAEGNLLADYELESLAAYLSEITDNEHQYSKDELSKMQMSASIPVDSPSL